MTGRPSPHAALEETFVGGAALPRKNGELVFEQPWQSRAFGLVVALHNAGAFEWEEFRRHLIARIGRWDVTHAPAEPYAYYEHWLRALEDVLTERRITDPENVEGRVAELLARPPGWDHDHDYDHPHHDGHEH
jgi:nitrile hydratase accessory protein